TTTGKCVFSCRYGTLASGSVKRVWSSKVRMPRSHSITRVLPVFRMYSAASRNSSIVADGPRLSSTGRPLPPTPPITPSSSPAPPRQPVGVGGPPLPLLGAHPLRHHRQACLRPRLGQQLQPLVLQALEAVGTGARLERPAAQARGPALLDRVRHLENLLPALH